MTRRDVLAEYCKLTVENASWAFGYSRCHLCHGDGWLYRPHGVTPRCHLCVNGEVVALTAPDPYAPGTETDCWLGVLVRHEKFLRLLNHGMHGFEAVAIEPHGHTAEAPTPTAAIVNAMCAADPELKRKMEECEQ